MSDSAMIICSAEINERTFAAFIESLGGFASAGKPARGSISQDEGDLYLALLTVEQWADFYAEQDVFEWAEHLGAQPQSLIEIQLGHAQGSRALCDWFVYEFGRTWHCILSDVDAVSLSYAQVRARYLRISAP
ncbi:hypothetical protein ACMSI6_10915 [Pseudomonas antarctica]|uniref:hypothetical protein n=1 Tax=Pseudomonas antarctica TaxID=219572 RepID=UPI00387B461C